VKIIEWDSAFHCCDRMQNISYSRWSIFLQVLRIHKNSVFVA
jgi:hypothetical protein